MKSAARNIFLHSSQSPSTVHQSHSSCIDNILIDCFSASLLKTHLSTIPQKETETHYGDMWLNTRTLDQLLANQRDASPRSNSLQVSEADRYREKTRGVFTGVLESIEDLERDIHQKVKLRSQLVKGSEMEIVSLKGKAKGDRGFGVGEVEGGWGLGTRTFRFKQSDPESDYNNYLELGNLRAYFEGLKDEHTKKPEILNTIRRLSKIIKQRQVIQQTKSALIEKLKMAKSDFAHSTQTFMGALNKTESLDFLISLKSANLPKEQLPIVKELATRFCEEFESRGVCRPGTEKAQIKTLKKMRKAVGAKAFDLKNMRIDLRKKNNYFEKIINYFRVEEMLERFSREHPPGMLEFGYKVEKINCIFLKEFKGNKYAHRDSFTKDKVKSCNSRLYCLKFCL